MAVQVLIRCLVAAATGRTRFMVAAVLIVWMVGQVTTDIMSMILATLWEMSLRGAQTLSMFRWPTIPWPRTMKILLR